MVTLDVPYAERVNGCWAVVEGKRERSYFISRIHAVNFAVVEAQRFERDGQSVVLSIEGADGKWRAFDTGMKSYDRR